MNIYKRIFQFLVGILIMSFGAVLLSKTSLGVAPWEALNFGLSSTFGLSTGNWIIILSFISLIIASILERKMINLLSFITSILIGFFMDFWIFILKPVTINSNFLNYLIFIVAIFILSFGIALYLLPKLPPNPIDYLMMVIKDKLNLKLMHAKLSLDVFLFILAIFFNGPIGLGTILLTLLVGPLINLWQNIFNKLQLNTCYKVV